MNLIYVKVHYLAKYLSTSKRQLTHNYILITKLGLHVVSKHIYYLTTNTYY